MVESRRSFSAEVFTLSCLVKVDFGCPLREFPPEGGDNFKSVFFQFSAYSSRDAFFERGDDLGVQLGSLLSFAPLVLQVEAALFRQLRLFRTELTVPLSQLVSFSSARISCAVYKSWIWAKRLFLSWSAASEAIFLCVRVLLLQVSAMILRAFA